MRLFIAIALESPEFFTSLQEPLHTISGVQMTITHTYHITLRFLGEITASRKDTIIHTLSTIQCNPFSLQCDRVGSFPSGTGAVRVIWAGFAGSPIGSIQEQAYQEGYTAILNLHHTVDAALKPLGFPAEKSFVPHVTLARIKSASPSAHHALRALLLRTVVAPKAFHIKGFSLIKSTLGRQGPTYETLWKSMVNR